MQCSHITRICEDSDKDTQLRKKKSNKYVCHAAQKNANFLDMRQKFEMQHLQLLQRRCHFSLEFPNFTALLTLDTVSILSLHYRLSTNEVEKQFISLLYHILLMSSNR